MKHVCVSVCLLMPACVCKYAYGICRYVCIHVNEDMPVCVCVCVCAYACVFLLLPSCLRIRMIAAP